MSEDRSKPPPGYEVEKDWYRDGEFDDDTIYMPRIPCPNFPRTEDEAIAICWTHRDGVLLEAMASTFPGSPSSSKMLEDYNRQQQALGIEKAANDMESAYGKGTISRVDHLREYAGKVRRGD